MGSSLRTQFMLGESEGHEAQTLCELDTRPLAHRLQTVRPLATRPPAPRPRRPLIHHRSLTGCCAGSHKPPRTAMRPAPLGARHWRGHDCAPHLQSHRALKTRVCSAAATSKAFHALIARSHGPPCQPGGISSSSGCCREHVTTERRYQGCNNCTGPSSWARQLPDRLRRSVRSDSSSYKVINAASAQPKPRCALQLIHRV